VERGGTKSFIFTEVAQGHGNPARVRVSGALCGQIGIVDIDIFPLASA
jgi:hypothetical protein